jgi:hypothetical protein
MGRGSTLTCCGNQIKSGERGKLGLVEENRRRQGREPKFDLIDTRVFDIERSFDIFVDYAKGGPQDICTRIRRSAPAQRMPL